jgi:hypothetical protein
VVEDVMTGVSRTMRVIGGLCFVALAVYVVISLVAGDLPDRVPMQFDGNNDPTWYASPAGFYAWTVLPWLGVNALLLLVRPKDSVVVDCAFAVVNAVFLLIFHVVYQNAVDGEFLRLTANGLVVLLFPVWLGIIGGAIYKATQNRRNA